MAAVIAFGFVSTPGDADDPSGEAIVTIRHGSQEIARVVILAGGGGDYVNVDVKPKDFGSWTGGQLAFEGAQNPDVNGGQPSMTRRTDRVDRAGMLVYTTEIQVLPDFPQRSHNLSTGRVCPTEIRR